MSLPKTAQIDALFQSILQLKDEEECRRYFEDLCTIKEVQALAQRLEIARRLDRGDSYLNTVEHTGASSATVSRVNRCLEYGAGGYRFILDRLPKLEENT
ncbi:MAG: YerC/YecD family TrpR-related protein [Oscillospiraceae bacterium]|nr:YerC/YecD family TrpR-related protein [Clostridiales bacterium]MDY2960702.1 YerC/YecD family TrpR-related protein [Oscillospiraceae bacterium]MDD6078401.1 YerC/YecD family TrpR-related protein [Clostridiales bacterium]MDD6107154.1 YerC/YecD family TrpR-related protein [Clostridiales bacterium]MDD6935899.1 YerC/YecD family TrpR-related protein [Clostridiales bacterium]